MKNTSRTQVAASDPERAAAVLRKFSDSRPALGIVLGSGFHELDSALCVEKRVSYRKLPGFCETSVAGHAGELLFGKLAGVPVLVLSGRIHFYEGQSMARVTFPIRAIASFGVRDLLLTNAAGGIRRTLRPGDFTLLKDHINWMGDNPLRGVMEPGLSRFVDLTTPYDPELRRLLQGAARRARVRLNTGVYLAVSGPCYETPAEIRAFRKLGADAVGMSTVPEAIVARQLGMRVAGISCITNPAAGLSPTNLSHADVLNVAKRSRTAAARLLVEFASMYARSQEHHAIQSRMNPARQSRNQGG